MCGQAFGVADAYSGSTGAANDLATEYGSLATFLFVWNGIFTCEYYFLMD
jgi:hypothetical protein